MKKTDSFSSILAASVLLAFCQPCAAKSLSDSLSDSLSTDSVTTTDSVRTLFADRDTAAVTVNCDRLSRSRLFQCTYIGVPLIIGGIIEKHQDTKFRTLRNDFMPKYRRPFDDYMQYAPAAVMLGMKAFGVPSRSSWGRMIVSDAFSAAIMASTVQILKTTTGVTRPDGSNNHSFPSGHTATAFMTATMLSKEYGHLSPWVSVGGYTVATATGLMRMFNNKHWLSDVMVGAGIGIISTEFGYWLADAICKDKGLNHSVADRERMAFTLGKDYKPSFLSFYMGFNVPLSHYDLNEDNTFETSTGTTLGLEGAYFFHPHIGVGGRLSVSNLQYIVNGTEAPDNTFDFYSFYVGPYFSWPVTPRWHVGSKLLVGSVYYPAAHIGDSDVESSSGPAMGTGLSIDYMVQRRLSASVFLDYNVQPPHSRHSNEYIHVMTLGAKACIRF